jgi:DinB family protein
MTRYLVIAALAATAGTVQPSGLDDSDRAYLVAHLEMTRQFLTDATQGLTDEQWVYSPGPGKWSIAQCVDHLAHTEEYVLAMVQDRLLKSEKPFEPFESQTRGAPAITGTPERMPRAADALLIRAMTDRTAAVRQPVGSRPPIEEVAPRMDVQDHPKSALDAFLKVRSATIAYMRTTQDDLRGHYTYTRLPGYYPDYQFQDGYQWLLRMSAHTERHLMQIHEVKESSGYPAAHSVR